MDDKIFDQIQQVDLKKTMESSYIDYAMSVIASRARRREKTTTDAGVVLVGLTICSTR